VPAAAALKRLARGGVAALAQLSGAPGRRMRGKVCILAYHRVLSREEVRGRLLQPGMYVLDTVFDMHLRHLRRRCQIVSLAEILRIWELGEGDRNARYCALTFDDGWHDNYRNALPLLRRHGAPATVFLTTSAIGTGQWFWPERLARLMEFFRRHRRLPGNAPHDGGADPVAAEIMRLLARRPAGPAGDLLEETVGLLKRHPEDALDRALTALAGDDRPDGPGERALLSWEEVREMSAQGVTFGSHGCRHRILTRLPAGEVEEELVASREALQRPGVAAIPVFAYPNGDWTPAIAGMARAAGYRAALTTRFGLEGLAPGDLHALRRVCVHNDVASSPALFASRIAGMLLRRG
jgi:peptidoglycan/xylan/chitin deacetylase (PgdA/CDA1 family)